MMVILIETLVRDPLILTFYAESLREPTHVFWSLAQSFIFFVDIFVNFMTGYVSRSSDAVFLDPQLIFG